jgi:membrane associated rhomboid family serine protease
MLEYFLITPVASAIFAVTILTSLLAFSNPQIYDRLILSPHEVYRKQNVYTLLTSGLIHKDWMHLFFNMLSYYFFAFNLERIIGHWQFAVLYLVSLVLSDIPTVLKHKNDFWYRTLGASGAVSAVVFSFILFDPMTKMMILPLPIPIPAILFGVLYLVYCVYAGRQQADTINHDAHFYGALNGIFITVILYPEVIPYFFGKLGLR